MDIEVRLVRSFLAVAEELHFSRAAERLNLSQPALSRQVRDLERRIGTELFVRATRSVTLTESGALLLREAPRVLSDLQRVVERAQGAGRGELGHVSIGFIGSAVESFVTRILHTVRTSLPGLTFTLTERPWIEQTAGIESGLDDLAFVRDIRGGGLWQTMPLLSEPICLVVTEDHSLASKAVIEKSDLPVLVDEPFATNRSWIATHCADWPFRPKVADEMISTHGILALVRAHLGISLMPASYATWGPTGLCFIPVDGQTSTQQVAWNAERSSSARDVFLDAIREWTAPETETNV